MQYEKAGKALLNVSEKRFPGLLTVALRLFVSYDYNS